jgi:hypothetical protein
LLFIICYLSFVIYHLLFFIFYLFEGGCDEKCGGERTGEWRYRGRGAGGGG